MPVFGLWIFTPILLVVAALWANRSNKDLIQCAPHFEGFYWGYFLGYSSALFFGFGIIIALFFTAAFFSNGQVESLLVVACLVVLWFAGGLISGFLTIHRNRWGLVGATVFSANPIIWIVNLSYISDRWEELLLSVPEVQDDQD